MITSNEGPASPARWVPFAVLSAVVAGAVMAAAYGVWSGVWVGALLMATGIPVLLGLYLLIGHRERLGTLSRQFAVAVGFTITGSLTGLWLIARLLFVSAHDAFTMALLLSFAAALTAFCAWMLASRVRRDIQGVRDGLLAVGEGSRRSVPATGAEDETAQLAGAANVMIRQLVEREAERDAAQAVRHDLVAAMVDQLIEHDEDRNAADASRRGLIVGISHDTRTPLTALKLLASAIADDAVEPALQKRYAKSILTQVDRFVALLDELFEFARLEAEDNRWTTQPTDLGRLIGKTVEDLEAQAAENRVAVSIDVPDDLPTVEVDPHRIKRVLVNLLQNALHHTPPAGSIRCSASTTTGFVEVAVADSGAGIAASERAAVFEPFFRGGPDASRTRPGAGLGLSICRLIIEAHGGRIWLGEAGAGTRLCFSLPRSPHPAEDVHENAT